MSPSLGPSLRPSALPSFSVLAWLAWIRPCDIARHTYKILRKTSGTCCRLITTRLMGSALRPGEYASVHSRDIWILCQPSMHASPASKMMSWGDAFWKIQIPIVAPNRRYIVRKSRVRSKYLPSLPPSWDSSSTICLVLFIMSDLARSPAVRDLVTPSTPHHLRQDLVAVCALCRC